MSEINIIEIAVAVLAVVSLVEIITINRISRNLKETERMVSILLRGKMSEMANNLRQGLENLFNPKDEPKNNVKKTRTNRKTK